MMWRERIARYLAPEVFAQVDMREHSVTMEVNQRVAEFIAKMDPFEPLMRSFNIVFTDDYEKPEQGLNTQSQILLKSWAYGVRDDPSFKHLMQWIINQQGNNAIRKGNPTPETILFSRAMLAAPVFVMAEVRRLAQLYEELILRREEDFDPHSGVE